MVTRLMLNLGYDIAKFRSDLFYDDFNSRLAATGRAYAPHYVLWDCTRRCNLHCVHCGAAKEKYSAELSNEEVKRVIDELAAMRVRFFAATGGEPLLRSDLLDVLRYACGKGLNTGFATNGFFIDEAKAAEIKDTGISSIQVSLDGLHDAHNAIRGNAQSFQNAVCAIRLLLAEGIPVVTAATTITKMNYGQISGLRNLMAGLGVRMWRICLVMPIGRARSSELHLEPGQLKGLLEFVEENNKNGYPVKITLGENMPFLANFEKRIRSEPNACPVGFTACCLGVDGNVRGCPEMPDRPENREGNVLEKPFAKIWNEGFKKYRVRAAINDSDCSCCASKKSCFGGCWVMHEAQGEQCIYRLLGEKPPLTR